MFTFHVLERKALLTAFPMEEHSGVVVLNDLVS